MKFRNISRFKALVILLIVKVLTETKTIIKCIYSGIIQFLKTFNSPIRLASSAREMKQCDAIGLSSERSRAMVLKLGGAKQR